MASGLQHRGWVLGAIFVAALLAVLYWAEPEPTTPGALPAPPLPAQQAERAEQGMASGAAPDGAPALDEAAKSSSSAGAGEPPAASAPEPEDRVARNLDISWTEERYAAAQAEREAIREGALSERRKLNVEERMEYWAVESRLIDEIGPDAYDQFLYDNGRMNRTKVHWVASNSHAGQAGIEGGDILISYGGEPVFGPRSAREINRLVPPGEEIIVQVERNGQVLEFLLSSDMRNRRRSGIVNGMTLLPMAVEP